jgi:hypothetical protein
MTPKTPAVANLGGYFGSAQDSTNYVLGWSFTPTLDMRVTALGTYDHDSDGLAKCSTVAIFDPHGTNLMQSKVDKGTAGTLVDNFRYGSTVNTHTPDGAWLRAGVTYMIAAASPNENGYVFAREGEFNSFSLNLPMNVVANGTRYLATDTYVDSNGKLLQPTHFYAPGDYDYYFGPNFQAEPVPEPATMAAFGLGAAALLRRRRAKKN